MGGGGLVGGLVGGSSKKTVSKIGLAGQLIAGGDDPAAEAARTARKAEESRLAAEDAERAKAMAAYNSDQISSRRRRRASSVLTRDGSGLSDTAATVLASAATYGKNSLGA